MNGTKIQWCDDTFNPWIGCTKVSDGCKLCYAERRDKRFIKGQAEAPHWGAGAPRVLTSDANWKEPLKWNKEALASGTRRRVFCASLADVFDPEVPTGWRQRLLALIDATPNLDWLLLTKRPQWIPTLMDEAMSGNFEPDKTFAVHMPNVWLGTTVENQDVSVPRIRALLDINAKVRFLSCEPLLGPLDLQALQLVPGYPLFRFWPLTGAYIDEGMDEPYTRPNAQRINWVIAGGESGPGCRAAEEQWFVSLRNQCAAAKVPFFMKQMGGHPNKRGALEDLPEGLQVREFPFERPE